MWRMMIMTKLTVRTRVNQVKYILKKNLTASCTSRLNARCSHPACTTLYVRNLHNSRLRSDRYTSGESTGTGPAAAAMPPEPQAYHANTPSWKESKLQRTCCLFLCFLFLNSECRANLHYMFTLVFLQFLKCINLKYLWIGFLTIRIKCNY